MAGAFSNVSGYTNGKAALFCALVIAAACSSDADSAPNPNGKDEGAACTDNSECKSLTCKSGKCTAVTGGNPTDGTKNGDETDVDCGGSAPACADGKACKVGGDCASGACTSGKCKAPAPDDKIKNGDESDVDCGGTKAPKCAVDKGCKKHEDCASGGCSYANKCAPAPSCTAHFGGDTCGEGETGTPGAKHESCCATVTNDDGLRIGKYLITAGRMRAFVERFQGKLQDWAANAEGWDGDTDGLPATMDDAMFMLGPNLKRGCNITRDGKGGRTYWQEPNGEDKNDFPKDVLDEKALNCVPQILAQALCVYDGGRLPSHDEVRAIVTNNGQHEWPWQFRDPAPHREEPRGTTMAIDDRLSHWRNYVTPNPPTDMRQDPRGGPLDRSFFIAPPGRFPASANEIGVQDAVGNLLTWVNDSELRFAWTASWEEHEMERRASTWPGENGSEDEINGYYAIGARCVFDK